jgi:YVTN family beta-propeller protein
MARFHRLHPPRRAPRAARPTSATAALAARAVLLTRALLLALLLPAWALRPAAADSIQFESAPVHPVDLTPNKQRLLAVHTADHRLVVFNLTGARPVRTAEIPVGLEPVTVRARTDDEAWVVNHVSDSISIVDLRTGNVGATLLVGDEPTDVVFAGSPQRAFVCVSQEDLIRVYDPANLAAAPSTVPLQTSDPRALAVSLDGTKVYVTALEGGNRTTTVPAAVVTANGGPPAPNPPKNPALPNPPRTGLIVRHNGTAWVDETGHSWSAVVPYTLLDNDVLELNAATLSVTRGFHDAGTAMFNVAVHPLTGQLYVTNQEALNQIRFEPNLRGRFVQSRVTIIDPASGLVTPRHLNSHIDYAVPGGSAGERALSLALPLDITIGASGRIYVAAFGSRKLAVLDAAGNVVRRIPVGGGPAGLALDEVGNRLYVLNRFSSTLSVVNLANDSAEEFPLGFDPTPPEVRDGRAFLYDGEITSAHGDLACGTCHLFASMDNLAWDLGNPQGQMIPVPPGQLAGLPAFHPMKGPMTTQSLKAILGTEPLHWRGDRGSLADFNPAFVNLMGRGAPLTTAEFALFTAFIGGVRNAPNPFRQLDGSLPASLDGANPQHGQQLFLTGNLVGLAQCVTCHVLPTGENGLIIPGNLLQEDEGKKVPQLRNMYEKTRFDNTASANVRGFGFTHDGAVDDLFSFLQFPAFTFANDNDRRDVAVFLKAFDSGTPPAVGAQWTMNGLNLAAGLARIATLQAASDAGQAGLFVKGRDASGRPRGWTYAGGGGYTPDRATEPPLTLLTLVALAGPGTELTFTGVVKGTELRLGIDRDLDGYHDGDELDAGSDPGDPSSTPASVSTDAPVVSPQVATRLWMVGANPASAAANVRFEVGRPGPVRLAVYDVRGRLVRDLLGATLQPAGVASVAWDLRDGNGRPVPAGVYFIRLLGTGEAIGRRITVVR